MDKHQAQQTVAKIANLADFAERSQIPLRTLRRLKAGHGVPGRTTLIALEAALKRVKPELKQEAA